MQTPTSTDLLDKIIKANSMDQRVRLLVPELGVDHVTFHLLKSFGFAFANPFVRTTYPDDWVSHYLRNSYIAIDPVVQHAMAEGESFGWTELKLKPEHRDMLVASMKFGLGASGHSFVFEDDHGRQSVLSLNSSMDARAWRNHMEPLIDLCETILPVIHAKGVTEALAERGGMPSLTLRELECLSRSSTGQSYSTIAGQLDLSEHTVRSYLKMARTKMGCTTLAQAVGKAVRSGIL
ncbi:MAG: helix-turn-helix transcriptional regulator [Paracoccaceae bacterium]